MTVSQSRPRTVSDDCVMGDFNDIKRQDRICVSA